MKKLVVVILVMILICGCVFTTAQATSGEEMGVQALQDLSIVCYPSDNNVNEQPFVIGNPNSVPVTFEYGTINNPANKLGEMTLGPNEQTTIYVANVGQKGGTFYLFIKENNKLLVRGFSCEYYVYVNHVTTDGTLLLQEQVVLQSSLRTMVKISPKPVLEKDGVPYRSVDGVTHVVYYDIVNPMRTVTLVYKDSSPQPYEVKINYINADMNTLITQETLIVNPGEQKSIFPSQSYLQNGGREYNLQIGQAARTHNFADATREYNFYYKVVPLAPARPYSISVRYVLDTGRVIASRNVTIPVGQNITVDLPKIYSVGNGEEFERVAGESTLLHQANNPQRVYNVPYRQIKNATEPYEINVNLTNAVTGQILQTKSLYVGMNQSVTYDSEPVIYINGQTYYIASGQSRIIYHDFVSPKRNYDIYYTDGSVDLKEYEITINYRKNVDNEILYTHNVLVPIKQSVNFSAPIQYTKDRVVYTMSGGQALNYTHNYGEKKVSYDVFYLIKGNAKDDEPDDVGEGDIQVIVGPPEYIDEVVNLPPTYLDVPANGLESTIIYDENGNPISTGSTNTEVIEGENEVSENAVTPEIIENGETPASVINDPAQNLPEQEIEEGALPLNDGFVNEDGTIRWGLVFFDVTLFGLCIVLIILLLKARKNKEEV